MADEKSKQGLEAFAKYWYDVFGYAYESGDFSTVDAITDPNCATCSNVEKVVKDWFATGGWTGGGRFEVSAAQSKFVQTDTGRYQVVVQVKQRALTYFRHDGAVDESNPESEYITDIMVANHASGEWKAEVVEHARGKQ